jgi:uncharacterized protein (DUF2342 family)
LSDQDVAAALEAMEQLIHQNVVEPDAIAAWRQRFDQALVTAERGVGWSDIVVRAHELSGKLDAVATTLAARRDEIRKELDLQAQGVRALKGYKPS